MVKPGRHLVVHPTHKHRMLWPRCDPLKQQTERMLGHVCDVCNEPCDVGAFIIRIRFWGILYYNYNKEPHNGIDNYSSPHITP